MNSTWTPVLAILCACVFGGCAGTSSIVGVPGYKNRAVIRTEGGVQASTTVLSPEEARRLKAFRFWTRFR
ncbi:hypothetical protein B0G75_105449 [Paraburkholderia sp. BL18I3N2]|nr:hypothetical protein B0G75_105449 [Paraburkholderia sp. BL18I3N2]